MLVRKRNMLVRKYTNAEKEDTSTEMLVQIAIILMRKRKVLMQERNGKGRYYCEKILVRKRKILMHKRKMLVRNYTSAEKGDTSTEILV